MTYGSKRLHGQPCDLTEEKILKRMFLLVALCLLVGCTSRSGESRFEAAPFCNVVFSVSAEVLRFQAISAGLEFTQTGQPVESDNFAQTYRLLVTGYVGCHYLASQ